MWKEVAVCQIVVFSCQKLKIPLPQILLNYDPEIASTERFGELFDAGRG